MNAFAALGWKIVPKVFGISPHGIGIAVGYIAGTTLLARRARKWLGVEAEHVWNFMTYGVIGVIIGARLFYVVGHYSDVTQNGGFVNIFKIQNGGIVLYGGIFGALVAVYPYIRKHRLPYRKLLDHAGIGLALGIVIGRIGDLVIGDHLGGPTRFFLGYKYLGSVSSSIGPPGCPVNGFGAVNTLSNTFCPRIGQVVHQTALYDFISALLLLPLMLWLGRKRRRTGVLITVAAGWYATGRLIIDFTRTTTQTYFGLRGTQWVSVAIIAAAVAALLRMTSTPAPAEPDAGPLAWKSEDEGAEQMVDEGGPVGTPVAAPSGGADDTALPDAPDGPEASPQPQDEDEGSTEAP
ncbi:MAG: prolipoprotein diacylglyceryl transferase [Actinobacteria bacterium]|nr:prolipoprotein diacylglyceryl transferase [Actinomycetota bacterium]